MKARNSTSLWLICRTFNYHFRLLKTYRASIKVNSVELTCTTLGHCPETRQYEFQKTHSLNLNLENSGLFTERCCLVTKSDSLQTLLVSPIKITKFEIMNLISKSKKLLSGLTLMLKLTTYLFILFCFEFVESITILLSPWNR